MSYVIKLKRSTGTISVKHVIRNVTLNHVGRRGLTGATGATGPTGPQGEPGEGLTATPTKGSLLVGNGSAWVELPVGDDDLVLTADSTQPTGLIWAVGGGGSIPAGGSFDFMDDTDYQFMDDSYFDFMDA